MWNICVQNIDYTCNLWKKIDIKSKIMNNSLFFNKQLINKAINKKLFVLPDLIKLKKQ